MSTRRAFFGIAAAAMAAPALPRAVAAQPAWPARSIKAMIPFSAGSSIDIVGRIVLDPVSKLLGQAVIVENKGGAGGSIGSAMVAQAEPDGYTILINASAHSATPAVYPNAPYDVVRDFAAVVPFGTVPNVIIVAPQKGIKTLRELADAAKSGNLTFASAGFGSATHWAAERFRASAGFAATHVPFRGGPEAITEVMTGRVDFACMGVSSAIAFINDKSLVPLAVCTPKRSSALPDVPTSLELGFADSDYNYWMGIFVPAKTDRAIIERLRRDTLEALATPNVIDKFKPQGIEPLPLSPAEFDALVKKEVATNIALAKAAGIKVN